jgi:tetratricopeptide (TPR) repeat protein
VPDLYARWLNQAMLTEQPEQPGQYFTYFMQFSDLQIRRMKYAEFGTQAEIYGNAHSGGAEKDHSLDLAIHAYHAAGDDAQELRLLQLRRTPLVGGQLDRYLTLLYARDPRRLIELARTGSGTEMRNAAAAKILERGDAQLTRDAMQARGSGISPLWARAYTGLAGLYLADAAPQVNDAFVAALDSGTIGQRLGKRLDRREQLAGDIWFYYGSRYGEYLDFMKAPNAEDYLPSQIEGKPASAGNFLSVADYYAEKNNAAAALADYDHALELNRALISPNTGAAAVLWKQGRRDEAVARWKLALAACEKQASTPQMAGQELDRVLESLKQSGAYGMVAAEAERAVRAYLHYNGAMMSPHAFRLAAELAGVSKAVELAASAPDETTLLGVLARATWVQDSDRDPIFQKILDLAQRHVAENFGQARIQAEGALRRWRMQYVEFLLDTHQAARAEPLVAALRAKEPGVSPDVDALEIRAAAMGGKLDALLERYRRAPEKTPEDRTLQDSAADLRKENAEASRRLLEFAYSKQLEMDSPAPAAFLGLAGVRLSQSNVPAALVLLRRMNLVSGDAFENLLPAARLLESNGHPAEANEFLATRLRAVPWDFEARLMSARLTKDQAALAAIGRDPHAPYEVRAQASGADPVAAALRAPDAAARLRALLDVIAASPEKTAVRFEIFRAALENKRDRLAVSAIEPLIHAAPQMRGESDEEEGGTDQSIDQSMPPPLRSRQKSVFLPAMPMDDAHRAVAAGDLARAHERLGELGQAASFYGIAGEYDNAATWKREADRVNAEIARINTNTARRPEIKVALEQSRTVRPLIGRQP